MSRQDPPLSVDLAAERALVGGLLADPRRLAEVATLVKPEDLHHAALRLIYEAVIHLDSQGQPVDSLTLAAELQARGTLAEAGGLGFLADLDTAAPTSANAEQYARIVSGWARRRRLIRGLQPVLARALNPQGGPTEDLILDATQVLSDLGVQAGTKAPEQVRPVILRVLDVLDEARNHKGGITGTPSGIGDLDKMLTGMHAGELIILAARPGVGKTGIALQIALHVALKAGKCAAFFSLEMPSEQLGLRLLANSAKVSLKRLREGGLSDHDFVKINNVSAEICDAPLFVDDSGAMTMLDLRAKARRLKQRQPSLALIVIDYLQLMSGQSDSREQEIAQISRGLKQLAKELGLPIMALAQMSRKVEERKGGRPQLSDLRESGAIEQDADVVMFIHPESPDEAASSPTRRSRGGAVLSEPQAATAPGCIPVDLIIAKQRNGPTGSIPLLFLSEYTRFEQRARGDE